MADNCSAGVPARENPYLNSIGASAQRRGDNLRTLAEAENRDRATKWCGHRAGCRVAYEVCGTHSGSTSISRRSAGGGPYGAIQCRSSGVLRITDRLGGSLQGSPRQAGAAGSGGTSRRRSPGHARPGGLSHPPRLRWAARGRVRAAAAGNLLRRNRTRRRRQFRRPRCARLARRRRTSC